MVARSRDTVFAGETVLALAILVVILHQRRAALVVARSPLLKAAMALLLWGLIRLACDFPEYGLDAVRDAALTTYIIVSLAVARAGRGQDSPT